MFELTRKSFFACFNFDAMIDDTADIETLNETKFVALFVNVLRADFFVCAVWTKK